MEAIGWLELTSVVPSRSFLFEFSSRGLERPVGELCPSRAQNAMWGIITRIWIHCFAGGLRLNRSRRNCLYPRTQSCVSTLTCKINFRRERIEAGLGFLQVCAARSSAELQMCVSRAPWVFPMSGRCAFSRPWHAGGRDIEHGPLLIHTPHLPPHQGEEEFWMMLGLAQQPEVSNGDKYSLKRGIEVVRQARFLKVTEFSFLFFPFFSGNW